MSAPLPSVDGAVFVEVLTDEELSVVARPGPLPVTPFLDELDEGERETARRTAYRSLLARGVLDPPTPEAVARAAAVRDGSVDLPVRDDVRSLVALREGAEMVVAVARSAAAWQDFWYAHVVKDVVLLEQVSSDGLHRFALLEAEELARAVLGAAVHPDAGAAPTGGPLPVPAQTEDPTPPDEVLERLGAAFLRTDVVVRRVGDTDPPALTIFSGPGGCWLVEAAVAPRLAEPLDVETARARLSETLAGVRAELEVLRG